MPAGLRSRFVSGGRCFKQREGAISQSVRRPATVFGVVGSLGQEAVRLRIEFAGVVLGAMVLCMIAAHGRSTWNNTYVLLADALLHGHFWINWPGRIIDAAFWHGQHYVIDGPFPVLFLLPMVALWGSAANQTTVAICGGVIAIALAWSLLLRLGVATVPRLFLTLFFFAGTDLWWCAELGDVQFLAHVSAVCLTLAALLEGLGRRRGWLLGLFAVCATESRFPLVLALPLYAYFAAGAGRNALRSYLLVIAAGLCFWIGWNEAQYGLWYDPGHELYYHSDGFGHPTGTPYQLAYLPYNIYSFFYRAPEFVEYLQVAQWPYIKCNPSGIALTFTSPALLLALLARRPRALVVALWVTVFLVAGPNMLYYLDGFYQFGNRHALDFEPFLLVLMALAVREAMPRWGQILCVYSAVAGVWGVWFWGAFFRTGN